MEADKIPPHLSAEEHSLLAIERQLLKDGRQWLKRAADLYTQTPKIKIWVPVVSSMLMTSYYLYTIHASAAAPASLGTPSVQTAPVAAAAPVDAPVVVTEDTSSVAKLPPPTSASAAAGVPATGAAVAEADSSAAEAGSGDSDLLKRAQQAHADTQYGEEAAWLQKFADHSGFSQQVCPEIGKAYERSGQADASIKAFEQCLSSEPGNVETMLSLAHALQSKPDFKRASSLYRQSIRTDPGNLDAQSGLALIELRQNHLREADALAHGLLQKAPANTDALLVAGIVAWREARLTDAEKIFSKGAGLDDHRADFHAFLGRVAEAQRRPQDALQQYERALAIDPNDSEISDRRNRLKDLK